MQQDHPAPRIDIKHHPSDPVLGQTRPHFVKPIAQRSTDRHSNRPSEFQGFDVYADLFPVLDWAQRSQPLAYWLSASAGPKKRLPLFFSRPRAGSDGSCFTISQCTTYGTQPSCLPRLPTLWQTEDLFRLVHVSRRRFRALVSMLRYARAEIFQTGSSTSWRKGWRGCARPEGSPEQLPSRRWGSRV